MLGLTPASDGKDKLRDVASSREQRRLSIKAAKLESRKQELEAATMRAEDKLSELENEEYRVRVHAPSYHGDQCYNTTLFVKPSVTAWLWYDDDVTM